MAALASQSVTVTGGVALTFSAAAGGGDTVPPGSLVLVKNGSGSTITVTVVVPGSGKYGVANPDYTVSVAASATVAFGKLPQDLADPSDGLVHLTYSGVTTLTVAVISI